MNNPKVSGRDLFYGRQASADDLQRMAQANRQARMNSMLVNSGMGDIGMPGGQSLDELVNENQKEQQRRNFQQQMGNMDSNQSASLRRVSMLEFGTGQNQGIEPYQFRTPTMASNIAPGPNGGTLNKQRLGNPNANIRRQSMNGLGLDTQFDDMASFGDLTQSPIFQPSMDSDALDLDPTGSFMRDIPMSMDYGDGLDADVNSVGNGMSIFPQPGFSMPVTSAMQQQAGM